MDHSNVLQEDGRVFVAGASANDPKLHELPNEQVAKVEGVRIENVNSYDNAAAWKGLRSVSSRCQQLHTFQLIFKPHDFDYDPKRLQDETTWNEIVGALESWTTLATLQIQGYYIPPAAVEALAKILRQRTALTTLHLENNDIGEEGARAVAEALAQCTALTTLDLG